eukprot:TRINITY_DN17030_c0_g1_i3.p1 TRINITY_DN17030_c0_g1~~TRINITY_DN17030_c0_g1_i3.p1  ORF type:complete len:292 (+),score=72.65 TRINITY_DN17030_c0_g1_i3:391-1266(+)
MGKAFKRLDMPRKDIVVSTKFFRCGAGANDAMLSRKHLIEGVQASLERLQLDYVDVAFAHRHDPNTPIEEVCRAYNWMLDNYKCFYWATSEWSPGQIREANMCCERLGLIKPVAEQPQYSLLVRKNFEVTLAPLFEKMGYGSMVSAPLAGGFLTGKYNDKQIPEGSRFAGDKLGKEESGKLIKIYEGAGGKNIYSKLKALGELAKELKCTQAQLAMAWCIVNKDVSSCLVGATNPSQILDNLGALEVAKNWTAEIEKRVEGIVRNKPTPDFNWRDWKPLEPRRSTQININS